MQVLNHFFTTLKNEIYYQKSFAARDAAKMSIIDSIEAYYNCRRPHLSIDYRIAVEAIDTLFERRKPMEKVMAVAA